MAHVAECTVYVACLPVVLFLFPVTIATGVTVGMAGTVVGGVGLGLYAGGKYIATGKGVSVEKYSRYADEYFNGIDAAMNMPPVLFQKIFNSIPASQTRATVVPVEQDDPMEVEPMLIL